MPAVFTWNKLNAFLGGLLTGGSFRLRRGRLHRYLPPQLSAGWIPPLMA